MRFNRRDFLKTTAIAAPGFWMTTTALSAARAADKPNGKLHFAGVGVGGKGSSDIDQCGPLGTVIALCDIDDKTLAKKKDASTVWDGTLDPEEVEAMQGSLAEFLSYGPAKKYFPKLTKADFDKADTDKSGGLNRAELAAYVKSQQPPKAPMSSMMTPTKK